MQISSSQIKRIFWASLLSFAIIIIPQISHALTVQEVPNPQQVNRSWVTDMGNIISSNTEAELNRIISELEAKNGTEIAVVTVAETAPSPTPKAFATELFNYWDLGKKGQENGVLFLISVGDKRVEIETGYGVEGILPDARVGNIIKTKITPRFKQQDFDGGILAGTKSLTRILGGEFGSFLADTNTDFFGIIGGGIVAAIAGLIASFKSYKTTVKIEPVGCSRISDAKGSIYWLIYASSLILIVALTYLLITLTKVTEPFLLSLIPIAAFTFCSWELGRRRKFGSIFAVFSLAIISAFITIFCILFFFPEKTELIVLISFVCVPTALFATLPLANIFYRKLEAKKRLVCQECGGEMIEIDREKLTPCLNEHQKTAEKIDSMKYEGLQCPHCSELESCKIHIRGYILNSYYSDCPVGNELTVISNSLTLESPTYSSEGKGRTTYTCQCCDYRKERDYTIARKVRESSSSSSSSSSGGSYGGSSGGSSSSGGGGGGSFGGGSSGGGGAGGSW